MVQEIRQAPVDVVDIPGKHPVTIVIIGFFCCIPGCRYNFSSLPYFFSVNEKHHSLLASLNSTSRFPQQILAQLCRQFQSLGFAGGCCIFSSAKGPNMEPQNYLELENCPPNLPFVVAGVGFHVSGFVSVSPRRHLILVGLAGLSQWRGPRFTTSSCQLKPHSTHKITKD